MPPSPKSEGRNPKEIRSAKPESTSAAAFFGIRIWTLRLTFERRSSYDDLRAEASRERAGAAAGMTRAGVVALAGAGAVVPRVVVTFVRVRPAPAASRVL